MVVVFVALAVGFVGGVFYSAHQSVPEKGASPAALSGVPNVPVSGIAELEKETARHPDNAEAWAHLGNLYFDADQVEKGYFGL